MAARGHWLTWLTNAIAASLLQKPRRERVLSTAHSRALADSGSIRRTERAMTAAPKSSIAHRTAIGASWMILWRMATRGLGLLSTLVLARILAPADFGLVAIATTYVAAFDALSVTGLQDAVIRSAQQDRRLLDTAFSLSTIRGFVNGAVIAASAPLAADYFAEPRLLPVLFVLAGLAMLEGVENIGVVEFRRDLRFDR